jgi:hypothetical protein
VLRGHPSQIEIHKVLEPLPEIGARRGDEILLYPDGTGVLMRDLSETALAGISYRATTRVGGVPYEPPASPAPAQLPAGPALRLIPAGWPRRRAPRRAPREQTG